MPSIGSSFAKKYDGMARMLCLLTSLFPCWYFYLQLKNNYKKPNAFYGLMLPHAKGLIGVFCAMDALVFIFICKLALSHPGVFPFLNRGRRKSVFATCFKFFVYTFTGSLLMLIGIIYVYLHTPENTFSHESVHGCEIAGWRSQIHFWLFFIAFCY